jgi:hypothetical protein
MLLPGSAGSVGDDVDEHLLCRTATLERHLAISQCVQGVIGADADILTRTVLPARRRMP